MLKAKFAAVSRLVWYVTGAIIEKEKWYNCNPDPYNSIMFFSHLDVL